MNCRQYSWTVTKFTPYWNNALCICIDTQKDKQWQNVGGGMNQAHAAEMTHVRKLSDDILYVQHFNYYLSAFIKHRHATAT